MKYIALFCTGLVLSGCVVVPNDAASARRDKALETNTRVAPPVAPAPVGAPVATPVQPTVTRVQPTVTTVQPTVTPVQPTVTVQGPVQASPSNPAPVIVTSPAGNAEISDEQDFEAVSGRQTIESDAERLEANRARYTVIQPTELPTRGQTPNIVAYALKTNNPVGVRLYRRVLGNKGRAARACSKYATADLAQQAFLARGGPIRDTKGLDPDGDGFACSWDPTPFRRSVQG